MEPQASLEHQSLGDTVSTTRLRLPPTSRASSTPMASACRPCQRRPCVKSFLEATTTQVRPLPLHRRLLHRPRRPSRARPIAQETAHGPTVKPCPCRRPRRLRPPTRCVTQMHTRARYATFCQIWVTSTRRSITMGMSHFRPLLPLMLLFLRQCLKRTRSPSQRHTTRSTW